MAARIDSQPSTVSALSRSRCVRFRFDETLAPALPDTAGIGLGRLAGRFLSFYVIVGALTKSREIPCGQECGCDE